MRQSIPLHTGATMMRSPICVAMLLAFGLAHPVSAQGTGGPKLRIIETNGIKMRIAEEGRGPLVLLLHGWPESWYSWRHQLPALAAAGYHAVAPDMRGYGGTDRPEPIDQYTQLHHVGDMVGLLDALGEPYTPRGGTRPTEALARAYGDRFMYMLYFQAPGVAEAELEADVRSTVRRV